jgi:hypothetical protein
MDPNISDTSSYLDLAPLYGSSQAQQDLVRTKVDGLLKPDCFYDGRILGFPPGVGGLLVAFNRFHNSIVRELAAINEGGRFSLPNLETIIAMIRLINPNLSEDEVKSTGNKRYQAALAKRDNDLFQTAKLYGTNLLSDLG